mgnify:CR=1 FL=1
MPLYALGFALFFAFIVLIAMASILLISLDTMTFEVRAVTEQIKKVTLTTMRLRPVEIASPVEDGDSHLT